VDECSECLNTKPILDLSSGKLSFEEFNSVKKAPFRQKSKLKKKYKTG
jgi:hypothetical protein